MSGYTTQRTAIGKINEYLEKINMISLGIEYKKGKKIEVQTDSGLLVFEYGEEFKLVTEQ